MSAQGVLALLLWLSCCGSALWRYSCNSPNFLMSGKRTTIKLEYEGTSFSEWSVPKACSVKDKRLPKTDMRCFPGFQIIKPIVSASDLENERHLFVANSHQCFSWYYKVINDFTKSIQVVFIWIYDPENADPDEVQRIANEPSLYSKALVKQFASFGQMPTIHTIKKRKTYTPDEGIKNGMWSITIPMTFGDGLKEIQGRPVAFLNCLVANSIFFLTFPFSTIPEMIGFLPLSSPRGSQLMADWEACATSNIVVVADMETFQSNDSFQTWTRIRVPPSVLTDEERSSVSDVSFSLEGVFFLIKGILYIKSLHEFTRLETNFNLPDEIIGITTRKWCWDKYLFKVKDKRSYIAVWTRDTLYLGYEHLQFIKVIDTNKLKQLLYVSPASFLSIHNVEYTEHPLELALLLESCVSCNISKKVYLIIYNEDTEQLTFRDLKMLITSDSHLSMHFAFSATPEFILTDKHRVYYYYQNFADNGILQTPTENGNLSKLSQNSTIHQVFMDYFGNIIVKMENNDMFFFKNYIKEAVKLHSWTTNTKKSLISMLPFSQVYFIYVSDNGDISTQAYPLQLEVQNVAFRKREVCPYIAFHSNILDDIYFLDKGQNLSFWVQVVYPEIRSMYILMESYGPNILGKKEKNSYEATKGRSTKTKAIDFFQSGNFEGVQDYFRLQNLKTGIVLFSFKPSDSGHTCLNPQKIFQVAIGCDSTKYIIVKGFEEKNCIPYEFLYDIEKSYLRHHPSKNLRVKYDWKIYGCPLRVNIRDKFQPLIQLYNEEGYVEDIYVNFIVWEINGRNDYTFNNTMAQSGCLTEAQTWKSMTELNKDIPLEDVWGPENYVHCFSYSGKRVDLNQPYEIINKTNKNHLVWPTDHIGMYVFRVKILDPNYSFCTLTAQFAIETYGLIPRPSGYHIAAVILPLILLYFAALFWSYIYFMNYVYQPDITYLVHNPSHKGTKS